MLKLMQIVMHIAILYGIYLIGNWIQATFHLFLPGSVIGMLLLFILLTLKVIKLKWVEKGTKLIVDNLALFFIPVTVGIINYYQIFAGKGIFLIFIIIIGTVFVMGGSGLVGQWLIRKKEVKHG